MMRDGTRPARGQMGMTAAVDDRDLPALRADYADTSDFATTFGEGGHVAVRRYDTRTLDLAAPVWQELATHDLLVTDGGRDLALLHERVRSGDIALDPREINAVTQTLADASPARTAAWNRLLREVVVPTVGSVHHQAHMTVRFHFPETTAAPAAGRRRNCFHTDVMLGHPPQMLNVWVPLSPTEPGNALLLVDLDTSRRVMLEHDFDFETIAARVQYDDMFYGRLMATARPIVVGPGEVVFFDARCLHAGQVNTTGRTRVSTDLRVLTPDALSRLRKPYRSGGRRVLPFAPGEFLATHPITA